MPEFNTAEPDNTRVETTLPEASTSEEEEEEEATGSGGGGTEDMGTHKDLRNSHVP